MENLQKGMPVAIVGPGLLTNGMVGEFLSYTKNAKGNILCLVSLYEGAPPVRIHQKNLIIPKPEKFWMVVKQIPRHSSYMYEGEIEGAPVAPRFKFLTKEDAANYGKAHMDNEYILLESVSFHKNDFEIVI